MNDNVSEEGSELSDYTNNNKSIEFQGWSLNGLGGSGGLGDCSEKFFWRWHLVKPLSTITSHYQPLPTIHNHYQPSSTITNHSLPTITYNYHPLPTITDNYQPLTTIINYY